jgi:MOSC domain-containing protein YiiM
MAPAKRMNLKPHLLKESRVKVVSIQVGQPQTLHSPDPVKTNSSSDTSWFSAISKMPVEGPIFLGLTNLAGDTQADLKNHGGSDKAVCVYAYEHYAHWQSYYGLSHLPYGAFGENFTTLGWQESTLCIGDTLAVGKAVGNARGEEGGVLVQVSQPRQPCWKLARQRQIEDLVHQVQTIGYTGWYFRVLQEGMVQAGDPLHLIERPYPHLTLAEANRLMHHDKDDWEAIAVLAACPLLSASWRTTLTHRLRTHSPADITERLNGVSPNQ